MAEPTIENSVNEFGAWSTPDEGRTWTLDAPTDLFDALRGGGVRDPDGSVTIDNGDGTGTRTTYDESGNVTGTEQVTGLPVPDLPTDPLADTASPRGGRARLSRPKET